MAEHTSADSLLEVAGAYAIDAVSPAERDQIRRRRAAADPATRTEFDRRVRAARTAMAAVSDTTAIDPPAALRDRILAVPDLAGAGDGSDSADGSVRSVRAAGTEATGGVATGGDAADRPDGPDTDSRGRGTADPTPLSSRHRRSNGESSSATGSSRQSRRVLLAAAAAVAVLAVGAAGWVIGQSVSRDDPAQPPIAEQVLTADDVRSSSGQVATGRATVTFSDAADAAVLVMNDVPPPQPGSVYQMWLIGPEGPRSAGTMTDRDVAPSTTAVIPRLHDATALAFTVEPPGGSRVPTGAFVAQLPLS